VHEDTRTENFKQSSIKKNEISLKRPSGKTAKSLDDEGQKEM
jgi:hypothetical protein